MSFAGRSSALIVALGASIITITACSDQAVAPRSESIRAHASSSALAQVGSGRHLIEVRAGGSATAVIARIRALGGTVTRSHEGAGIIVASGLSDAAAKSLSQHPDVSDVLKDRLVQWVPPKALSRS